MYLCTLKNGISILIILGIFAINPVNAETRLLTDHEVLHLKAAATNENATEENPLFKVFGHNRKERCFFSSPSSDNYSPPAPTTPWKIDPMYEVIESPRGPAKISASSLWANVIPQLGVNQYSY